MKVNRESLLRTLEAVAPGLAKREAIEQSTCFIFRDGRVVTFNDDVACSHTLDIGAEGAVTAQKLLDILGKLPEDEIDITQGDGELIIKGKGRKAGVRMDAEVTLPMEGLEPPTEWRELPEEFCDAVGIVQQCASTDTGGAFNLTCVHVHPKYLEACDNFQMTRYPLETGIRKPTLVKREAIRHVAGLGMTELAETKTWVHFRNPAGLVLACRRYLDKYEDMEPVLELTDGRPATLPGGLAEAVDRAELFSADNTENNLVTVELRRDKLRLRGEGNLGWFIEQRSIKYDGEPFAFKIGPKLLVELTKRHNEMELGSKPTPKLRIDTGKFQYVACLVIPEEE
jgi:hypothetical protein